MKGKAAFVLGAGLGYLLGTPAGREKLDKVKAKLTDSWHDPRVQEKVSDLRNKATSGSSSDDPWASPSPDVSSPSSSTTGSSTTGSSGGPDLGGTTDSDYRSTP